MILKITKEEYPVAIATLVVIAAFTTLTILSYPDIFFKSGKLGYWTIFYKNFRMSGYDCWSFITLSNLRVHFETSRHPLFLSVLYPLYWLNQWLLDATGQNCAVYIMHAIDIFCAFYTSIFIFRIMRHVVCVGKGDAALLTLSLFSIGHIMVACIVPDHFVISLFLLTLTLYITGRHLAEKTPMPLIKTGILLFLTAGITLTNGAKTFISLWFANKRKAWSPKALFVTVFIPLATLLAIWCIQYVTILEPQEQETKRIENKKRSQGKGKELDAWADSRNKWLTDHRGKPMSDMPILNLTDVTTSRTKTLSSNFFGESIQLHDKYLLEDMSHTRPMFVEYTHAYNYIAEAVAVIMFLIGLWMGRREKFMLLCLSWTAIDVLLHFVLGFGINEVYIMAADWIFIMPIAYAYTIKLSHGTTKILARCSVAVLTLWLCAWNWTLILNSF